MERGEAVSITPRPAVRAESRRRMASSEFAARLPASRSGRANRAAEAVRATEGLAGGLRLKDVDGHIGLIVFEQSEQDLYRLFLEVPDQIGRRDLALGNDALARNAAR